MAPSSGWLSVLIQRETSTYHCINILNGKLIMRKEMDIQAQFCSGFIHKK